MTIQDKPERLEITSSSPLFFTSDLQILKQKRRIKKFLKNLIN